LETKTDEIRLHFLSLRFGSKIYTKLEATSKKLPTQYIHHNRPQNTLHSVDPNYIYQELSTLINKLKEENYLLVQNIKENKKLHTLSQK
jgi:hypothetical protein